MSVCVSTLWYQSMISLLSSQSEGRWFISGQEYEYLYEIIFLEYFCNEENAIRFKILISQQKKYVDYKSNRKAMNRNWSKQKPNTLLKPNWEINKTTNKQKTMRTTEWTAISRKVVTQQPKPNQKHNEQIKKRTRSKLPPWNGQ